MGGLTEKQAKQVAELRAWFAGRALPTAPVQLGPGQLIVDPARFVTSHLESLESARLRYEYLAPFYLRLFTLKKILENGIN